MTQRYKYRILFVDDEIPILQSFIDALSESFDVDTAFDGAHAINSIQKNLYDLVILDIHLPRVDGMEVLRFVHENFPTLQVIIISGQADVRMAVQATKLGSFDVIKKPFDIDELENSISLALERKKHSILETELSRRKRNSQIIGQSKSFQQVLDSATRVADSDSIVLILGPSGCGKEIIARHIHESSGRSDGPFVPVNCSSIPDNLLETELFGHAKGAFTNAYTAKPGLVEVANGGTLFLDEVGDISPIIQPKLLRFLETGDFRRVGDTNELKANVRVVSATNKDLREEVRLGRFREDLLYRLNVITIRVPPLKEHCEDIPLLVEYFLLKKSNTKAPKSMSKRAMELLMMYEWPGNVRELEHVIEGAVIMSAGDVIDHTDLHLSDHQVNSEADGHSLEAVERKHIEKVLKMFNGNRKKTAEALHISEKGLYLKIKEYGIPVD